MPPLPLPTTTTTIISNNNNNNNNNNPTQPSSQKQLQQKNQNQPQKSISSQKLNPNKFASPFTNNTKHCKSIFSQTYISNSIPCRLISSGINYNIQWDDGAEIGFSPELLIICASGLIEVEHPYCIMAPLMFMELCERAEGYSCMFSDNVLDSVCLHIRNALSYAVSLLLSSSSSSSLSSGGNNINNINNNINNKNNKNSISNIGRGRSTSVADRLYNNILESLIILLKQAGSNMISQIGKIIPILGRLYINNNISNKKRRDSVTGVLDVMINICGPEAGKIIKSKIPTYQ